MAVIMIPKYPLSKLEIPSLLNEDRAPLAASVCNQLGLFSVDNWKSLLKEGLEFTPCGPEFSHVVLSLPDVILNLLHVVLNLLLVVLNLPDDKKSDWYNCNQGAQCQT